MAIIDSLSPAKRKFFESLGIYSDADIPESFNEKIIYFNPLINEAQKFCLDDYNFCFQEQALFSMRDLVGTDHQRYAGKTWLEAFMDLDRGDDNLELYFSNPNYYANLNTLGYSDLGLAEKDGKYYIFGRAGGGNNRLIAMKLKYLATVAKGNLDEKSIDNEFNILGNIRHVPSRDTADNIFYLVFPGGGYKTSGYYALNKSTNSKVELYDIVSGYPFNTKVVVSDVLGEDIAKFELNNYHPKSK